MMLHRIVILVASLFIPSTMNADDKGPSAGTPDSKRNAVGDDKAIRIFDAATGKEVIRIAAHTGKVTALAFSPDGKLLVSGSEDKTVRIFDAATGKAIALLKGHDAGIAVVGFSADGKTITTVDRNQKAIKWNPATGQQVP